MAENQILREKISTLQDQVTALTSWFWQLFPSPLLNTATIEPPNIQHSTLKVHTSVCVCTKEFFSVLETPRGFICTCI